MSEKLTTIERHTLLKMGLDLPPEDSTRIKIRVRSNTNGQAVHGTYVEAGEHEYAIYRSHLDAYEALVERAPAAQIQAARDHHARNVETYEAAKRGEGEYLRQYQPSYEASFHDLYGRDVLPFSAVEVVPEQSAAKSKAA